MNKTWRLDVNIVSAIDMRVKHNLPMGSFCEQLYRGDVESSLYSMHCMIRDDIASYVDYMIYIHERYKDDLEDYNPIYTDRLKKWYVKWQLKNEK